MPIALRSQSNTVSSVRTNTVITAPSGIVDNDILFAAVQVTAGFSPTSPTPPSGFARLGSEISYTYSGFTEKLGIWWKRAASESGSYTFTHASYDAQGWMGCFSGCQRTGTPFGTPTGNSGNSQTTTYTGVTTTLRDAWIIAVGSDWNWAGGLTPPSGMTEQFDATIYVATELRSSVGSTGNKTHTNSNGSSAEPFLGYLVELLPQLSMPIRRQPLRFVSRRF